MTMPLLTLGIAASALVAATCSAQTTPPPPPAMGAPMMLADTNRDGVVTRAEALAEASARFDATDTDHDGKVTPAERQAYRRAMRDARRAAGTDAKAPPPPPSPSAAGRGFGMRGDPEGDAAVTREAFVARAAARFDRMDANHDGKLDKDELARMRPFGGRRGDARGGGGDMPPPPPGE